MCTKKELEQNWNRTMIEATRLFFFLRRIDFFLYPQKSFSCPWHISCIIFKTAEDHNPTRGALLPLKQRLSFALRGTSTPPHSPLCFLFFIFFFCLFLLFLWRGKIPSAICWRRKAFAGEQDCSLLFAPRGCDCKPPLVAGDASQSMLAQSGMLKSRRLMETVKEGGEMRGVE